jgi:hypothetical protein
MILFLTEQVFHHIWRLSLCYSLDSYVVLSLAGGGAACYSYWVQRFDNGSMGFLQPVLLAM